MPLSNRTSPSVSRRSDPSSDATALALIVLRESSGGDLADQSGSPRRSFGWEWFESSGDFPERSADKGKDLLDYHRVALARTR